MPVNGDITLKKLQQMPQI